MQDKADIQLALFTATLLSFIMTFRLFYGGGWYAESMHYDGLIRLPYLLEQFKNSFTSGYLYPRWLPELYGGYGMPQFIYYQPGYFFFSLPFMLIFSRPEVAASASLYAILWLSFVGIYALARLHTSRLWSLACALLFFTSQKMCMLIMHGVSPHTYAACWAIWTFYFLYRMAGRISASQGYAWHLAGYTLCFAWTIISHPFVAVSLVMALPFLFWGVLQQSPNRRQLIAATFYGSVAAIVLTAGYWFSFFELSTQVSHEDFHRISVAQRLSRQSYGWALDYFISGVPYDGIERYFTRPMHFLALLGCALSWRKPLYRCITFSYLFLIFMQTRFSVFIWDTVPGINNMQFPSRLHNITDITRILAITQVARLQRYTSPVMFQYAAQALCAACVLLIASFYTGYPAKFTSRLIPHPPLIVQYDAVKYKLQRDNFSSFSGQEEIRPRTVSKEKLRNRFMDRIPVAQWQKNDTSCHLPIDILGDDTHIVFTAVVKNEQYCQNNVIINQFYFPGWIVRLNEAKLTLDNGLKLDNNGRMVLELQKVGNYNVEAFYDGPPSWPMRNALILTLLACIIFMAKRSMRPLRF